MGSTLCRQNQLSLSAYWWCCEPSLFRQFFQRKFDQRMSFKNSSIGIPAATRFVGLSFCGLLITIPLRIFVAKLNQFPFLLKEVIDVLYLPVIFFSYGKSDDTSGSDFQMINFRHVFGIPSSFWFRYRIYSDSRPIKKCHHPCKPRFVDMWRTATS